ncbi:MAG TPA: hypothetical protein VIJ00_17795 [Nakamurella sp.]|jgi:hypothetical protein
MSLAGKHFIWRASRALRVANAERRRVLEREMAGYASESDRCDFEAILDRYPDAVTEEMRDILTRQRLARPLRAGGLSAG